ncbi:DsbA family protein [Luteimonas sp. XNQY3]|nr:thioredoxin domain-containing protein [Luteimonas sp. XNQY3]MCD9007480.1 DsbA family protein [Luteimonas sp. XNQY3]
MNRNKGPRHRVAWAIGLAATAVLVAIAISQLRPATSPLSNRPPPTADASPGPAGPPWRYGRADARYTVTAYADLECPHCQVYLPRLKRWIDANPDVNWQWHHLPLAFHEPAATDAARLAECAGLTRGNDAFWHAVSWVYGHTRGNGLGVPDGVRYPGLTPALHQCLDSARPDTAIRAQADEAAQAGIAATPTLLLQDHRTGGTLRIDGPVDDDALLSAIDLVSAPADDTPSSSSPMSADDVGDMPR